MDGFRFFTRDSGGGLIIVTHHPRDCPTWHWYLGIIKSPVFRNGWLIQRAQQRHGQWHDYYRLPFGLALCWGAQDYHAVSHD